VVPVGKANLITTKEEIDQALETASHIFRQQNEEKEMEENTLNEELETSLEVTNETPSEATEENLVELPADELAAMPKAKYGRDKYGRALNKDGTPRKARNDKGVKRGAYGPRTPKVNTETTVTEVTQEVASSVVDSE
jgi:hypothetical protein